MTFPIVFIYILGTVCSLYFLLRAVSKSYLPLARPIAFFSFILSLHCILVIMEVLFSSLNVSQFVSDCTALIISLSIPCSLWMWYEFYFDKHMKFGWFLFVLIDPVIVFSVVSYEFVLSHFLSPVSNASELILPYHRFGAYGPVRFFYIVSVMPCLVIFYCWSIYRSKKMTRLNALMLCGCLFLPFIAVLSYALGFISVRLGGITMISLLLWGTYYYRILDIFPIAKNQIIKNINSGIMVFNSHQELIYINTFFKQLLNLSNKTTKGVIPLNQLAVDLVKIVKWDSSTLQKENIALATNGELLRGDNLEEGERFFHIELDKIKNKTHVSTGYILMLQEVTEQVMLRQEVLSKNIKLKNINQNRSNFFAGISHEFRTPLTLSCGYVESILNGQYEVPIEPLTKPLNLIYENNQRLLQFVNQLLDFSQLDGEKLPIKPIQINLKQHLHLILAQFESIFQQQGIDLEVQFNQKNVSILFDAPSFDKVIINLISNAVKSMPDGGYLNIEVADFNEDYWQLKIRDNGFGINEEIQSTLFEPFVYHEHHSQNWQKGSGVGLSLVKQILELHDGKIKLQHSNSQGTCFAIDFKKVSMDLSSLERIGTEILTHPHKVLETPKRDKENHTEESITYDESSNSKPLLLLVDDNTEIRTLINSQIGKDYKVIEASNGEQGLSLAKQLTPDVIITDIMMPVIDGLQMCQELKEEVSTSHIPIIILTAKSGEESLLSGLQSGADDFIIKPFNYKELSLRAENLITKQRNLRKFYSAQLQVNTETILLEQDSESLFIDTIKKYITENISKQKIHTSELANLVHMSERSINRKLKAITGMTPQQLLLGSRMQYAKNQLVTTNETIATISFSVGFTDTSYFSRAFKSYYNMTPKEYRHNSLNMKKSLSK